MNIIEHIEAGHYPKTKEGYSIIPTSHGWNFICTSHVKPGLFKLIGWADTDEDGDTRTFMGNEGSLLPPKPRIDRTITRWIEVDLYSDFTSSTWKSNEPNGGVHPRNGCVIIPLIGKVEVWN